MDPSARRRNRGFRLSVGAVACASAAREVDGAPDAEGAGADANAAEGSANGSPRDAVKPFIFVTSKGFTGNFATLAGLADGLAAADVLCGRAAAEAGLAGTFVAYLASSGDGAATLAADRI